LNNKGIIFRMVFELGCPVFIIAKKLDTSEALIYRYLSGEKIPRETEARLKGFWMDLIDRDEHFKYSTWI
jgi:hypothetical protein